MLKTKALLSALLLSVSVNTFALCVNNKTSQSIYFSSDQDWFAERKNEVAPGKKFCTKEGAAGYGYNISDSATANPKVICAALWTNVSVKNIDVIPEGEFQTCIIS